MNALVMLVPIGSQGMDEEANSLFQQTLDIRQNRLGPEHPRVATVLDNRANLLKKQVKIVHVQ